MALVSLGSQCNGLPSRGFRQVQQDEKRPEAAPPTKRASNWPGKSRKWAVRLGIKGGRAQRLFSRLGAHPVPGYSDRIPKRYLHKFNICLFERQSH